ncbi:MAG: decarboxylating 6-phosphogluconate dehydrogenase [Candidatus Peregrinibacteria bacterium]
MKLGYIGLGKMGLGMVELLLEKKHDIIAYAPSTSSQQKASAVGATAVSSLAELVHDLPTPRTVWLMVPHKAVDGVLEELIPLLNAGDTIIEGGNSPYKETIRRAKEIEAKNIRFLDIGVSGGPSGARNGACLMIGGKKDLYEEYIPLFQDIAAEGAYSYLGKSGAGHFVKMVHNGIEYGMMQAIGEGFEVLKKSDFALDLQEVCHIYNRQSVITSRLTQWLEKAFHEYGTDLNGISGSIAQSGEGLWTLETAQELGIPVPIIEGSVNFRKQSEGNPSFTGQVVSALRNQFGGHEVKA